MPGSSADRDATQPPVTLAQVFHYFPALAGRRRQLAGYLSGGERQMLALATALLCRPRVLLVDELSLGLAPLVVESLMALVARLRDELGLAVLLVEQYLDFAERLADAYVIMAKGSVVAAGATRDLRPDLVKQYLAV